MLKPIFKKPKEQDVQFSNKKIMLTDLCPEEKKRIGQMMIMMEKQKVQNKELQSQLKEERENRVIQSEYLEQLQDDNQKLIERIKELEEKYIKCERELEKQKQYISKIPQKATTKNSSSQTYDLTKQNVHIQTEPQQVLPTEKQQTVFSIEQSFAQQQDVQIKARVNRHFKVPPRPPQHAPKSNKRILTYQQLQAPPLSNQSKQRSASRLAKQWIKTKKQKIDKMKKDILKSQKKMYKQTSYSPQQSENNQQQILQDSSSETSSQNSQKLKTLKQYHQKLRKMKQRFQTSQRSHTQHNAPSSYLLQSRRNKIQKTQGNQQRLKSNSKLSIDDDTLNKLLKSKDFKANSVLETIKGPSSSNLRKSRTNLKNFYDSNLVDLIQNLQN